MAGRAADPPRLSRRAARAHAQDGGDRPVRSRALTTPTRIWCLPARCCTTSASCRSCTTSPAARSIRATAIWSATSALGLIMVREAINGISGFPDDLRAQIEHLIVSHHGTREHGSPVEPKTIEAFILAVGGRARHAHPSGPPRDPRRRRPTTSSPRGISASAGCCTRVRRAHRLLDVGLVCFPQIAISCGRSRSPRTPAPHATTIRDRERLGQHQRAEHDGDDRIDVRVERHGRDRQVLAARRRYAE